LATKLLWFDGRWGLRRASLKLTGTGEQTGKEGMTGHCSIAFLRMDIGQSTIVSFSHVMQTFDFEFVEEHLYPYLAMGGTIVIT
jgi:hypothetical protein